VLYSLPAVADSDVEIPNRALFKPSEVCELAKVQPYVLRSWELEFPALGVAKSPGGPRLYRKSDVELVLRIKQLVFSQGLTVAGARRTIEGEGGGQTATEPVMMSDLVDTEVRQRLTAVRHGLRSLLDMLSPGRAHDQPAKAAPATRWGVGPSEGLLPLDGNGEPAPVAPGPAGKPRAEARPRKKVVTAKAKTKSTPKTAAGVRKKTRK
jgi:DNA-binding transcriptional MerR regulator